MSEQQKAMSIDWNIDEQDAMKRLERNEYIPWHSAGGPNECSHGYAAGIPCPHCDADEVNAFISAHAHGRLAALPEQEGEPEVPASGLEKGWLGEALTSARQYMDAFNSRTLPGQINYAAPSPQPDRNGKELSPVAPAPEGGETEEDREILKLIDERDAMEERLTVLAEAVGSFFDVPVGEWSSSNDPDKVALEVLGGGYKSAVYERATSAPPSPEAERSLTFSAFQAMSAERCQVAFPMCDDWSLNDWAVALAGEVGELCNLLKKHRRGMASDERFDLKGGFKEQALHNVTSELADIIIYADLMLSKLGISTEDAVTEKFEEVSRRIGYRQSPQPSGGEMPTAEQKEDE